MVLVVAFEHFKNIKSRAILSSQYYKNDRIVVALDNPEKWILSSPENPHPHPHPYMVWSDICKIL